MRTEKEVRAVMESFRTIENKVKYESLDWFIANTVRHVLAWASESVMMNPLFWTPQDENREVSEYQDYLKT